MALKRLIAGTSLFVVEYEGPGQVTLTHGKTGRIVPLEDRVRVEALVNFHVRSGLVNEIVFRVPVKDKVHVQAPDRREVNYTDVDDGRVYVVSLRTPTKGSASAAVT